VRFQGFSQKKCSADLEKDEKQKLFLGHGNACSGAKSAPEDKRNSCCLEGGKRHASRCHQGQHLNVLWNNRTEKKIV